MKEPSAPQTPTAGGIVAPTGPGKEKEHFSEKILVCSPVGEKYVSSNRGTLLCNSDHTSLSLLYKDGFRLIQIVDDGKKAIYYLEKSSASE